MILLLPLASLCPLFQWTWILMMRGFLGYVNPLVGIWCRVFPWNRSMLRRVCDICIALPEIGRMRNHL